METLSGALIGAIFEHCSLRDALHASYTCRAWRKCLVPYLQDTYSLKKYLSCFREPGGLIRVFRETGSVLSGGRALVYFLPSLRRFSPSSQDWDIFIPYPHYHAVHSEILSQGFHKLERTKEQPYPQRFTVYDYFNDNNTKVQLVSLTAECGLYDCIRDFHTSVVQNGITGWGCFSMNWEDTFAGQGWFAERVAQYPEFQFRERAKYDRKGITIVPWSEWREKGCEERKVFTVHWGVVEGGEVEGHVPLMELKTLMSSATH